MFVIVTRGISIYYIFWYFVKMDLGIDLINLWSQDDPFFQQKRSRMS